LISEIVDVQNKKNIKNNEITEEGMTFEPKRLLQDSFPL